jgi:hypothetical protein
VGWVLGDAGQDVGQPSLRIHVIHLCRKNNAVYEQPPAFRRDRSRRNRSRWSACCSLNRALQLRRQRRLPSTRVLSMKVAPSSRQLCHISNSSCSSRGDLKYFADGTMDIRPFTTPLPMRSKKAEMRSQVFIAVLSWMMRFPRCGAQIPIRGRSLCSLLSRSFVCECHTIIPRMRA